MKKNAFTLYESLIVMAITAVLILVSLKTFSNVEEKTYSDLYAKAYRTLSVATYNILQDVANYNEKKNLEAQENGQPVADPDDLKRFPNILGANEDPTPAQLCNGFLGGGTVKGYINAPVKGCATKSFDAFDTDGVIESGYSFMASDGQLFYITDYDANDSFVVWVDINGKRRPNTPKYYKNRKPDIVPFVIDQNTGTVVPHGIPTYDINYLKARVVYANPDLDKDFSVPMTFYEAQRKAYLGYTWTLDPLSKKLNIFGDIATLSQIEFGTIATDSECSKGSSYVKTTQFPPCKVDIATFTNKR